MEVVVGAALLVGATAAALSAEALADSVPVPPSPSAHPQTAQADMSRATHTDVRLIFTRLGYRG